MHLKPSELGNEPVAHHNAVQNQIPNLVGEGSLPYHTDILYTIKDFLQCSQGQG